MMNSLRRHSLTLNAWGAVLIITILCVMSAMGSGTLAWVAKSDAEAINTAGSIRMAAYRISFQLATDFSDDNPFSSSLNIRQDNLNLPDDKQVEKHGKLDFSNKNTAEKVELLAEDMETRLEELQTYQLTSANRSTLISNQFNQIRSQWFEKLKPALLAQDKQAFYRVSVKYIDDVNRFVSELQYRNEQRQTWQQYLQILSLILTCIVMLIGIRRLNQGVLLPIKQLIKANNQFRRGKTDTRVAITGYREFEVLGNSFNEMASTIETYQRSLESEVQIKTQHLTKANQVLSLFYDFSKFITINQVSLHRLDALVADFSKALPHLDFTLCIQNKYVTNKNAIVLHSEKMQELCKKLNCDNCEIKNAEYTKSYPIAHQQEAFGELRVSPKSTLIMNRSFIANGDGDKGNDDNQRTASSQRIKVTDTSSIFPFSSPELDAQNDELIVALTSLISTALSLRKQRQQEHQLILFEERSTIARELHDSLAQSLSYLKIQVSVLERHLKNKLSESDAPAIYQNIEQIKVGLGSAYHQLRDLLVTFRLTIDNDNFDEALHEAASEFALKGGFKMTVNNDIMTLNLSAHEQIDLIQIAREALSNTSRHAKAQNVEIHLGYEEGDKHIRISIIDDGIGMLSGSVDQSQHHGLMIMKERASNIGGELIVADNKPHGTIITVRFEPDFFNKESNKEAYL